MSLTFALHADRGIKSNKREKLEAVVAGAERHGDAIEVVGGDGPSNCDGVLIFGISGRKRVIFDRYRAAGRITILFDKGYAREGHHLRISVDDFQPLAYLMRQERPADRLESLGVELAPYRGGGTHILFDGASRKFCQWKGFGDYAAWGAEIVERIRRYTDLPIIYRPRPTHHEDGPVAGAELSRGDLWDDMRRARVVVSYGGNIGWDAAVAGIPHFAIGDSIARPVSETEWSMVGTPKVPTENERHQWAANVAYSQFSLPEISSGFAWSVIREHFQSRGCLPIVVALAAMLFVAVSAPEGSALDIVLDFIGDALGLDDDD